MGSNNTCCKKFDKNSSTQLEIDRLIREDKIRYASSFQIKKYYDMDSLKKIQRFYKCRMFKTKFDQKMKLNMNIMIAELRHNFINETLAAYIKDSNKGEKTSQELILLGKIKRFLDTPHYNNKWKHVIVLQPVKDGDEMYIGSWNYNKQFHGYGSFYKTDGSKYEGMWEFGKLTGVGRFFTSKGDYFEGNFTDGLCNGNGEFYHRDGTIYKGEWLNDKPHGRGEEFFADGSYFKGNFEQGKKTQGVLTWTNGNFYEGKFMNEVFHGEGTYRIEGRVYQGEWKDGNMNGQGIFYYTDGSTYEGDFLNNQRHGNGKYKWSEEKYYEGQWENGNQHGAGIYYKNGKLIEGIWIKGKLTNKKVELSEISTHLNDVS